jgi:hypothetical protein
MMTSEEPLREPQRTMRPVAVLFFCATFAVGALLAATASFAVSPLQVPPVDLTAR